MHKAFTFLFVFFGLSLFAQKQERTVADYKGFCAATFPKTALSGAVNETTVAAFLKSYLPNLQADRVAVQFKGATESPGAITIALCSCLTGWRFTKAK